MKKLVRIGKLLPAVLFLFIVGLTSLSLGIGPLQPV
jgi:hypothetical protein